MNEPQRDEEGRVVCPAHVDRDLDALRIEFGKARVEIAEARTEIRGLKSIVTNGLQSDVTEIKTMVGHVRFLVRGIPILAAMAGVAKAFGVI